MGYGLMRAIADFFWGLRSGEPAPEVIPEEFVPNSLADGYRVQALLVERILSETGGGLPVGYKVACTNEIARTLLRTDGPVFGRLISSLCWPSGKVISAAGPTKLAVEPEFAFRMAEDVPKRTTPWDRESITPLVGAMLPAIEVVGHRFADWPAYFGPTLAADNAVNRGWVHGAPTNAWRNLDLASHPVCLSVNGEKRLTGSGTNVLGHPLNAVAWLANTLPDHGLRLRSGDYVTTGVCTDILATGPGESLEADFGTLGTVSLSFGD